MRPVINIADESIVLRSLEDLGAPITESNKLPYYYVKPFRDWAGSPQWKDKVFTFRLCNASELQEIYSYVDKFPSQAQGLYLKIEFLIRAIVSVSGESLVTDDVVERLSRSLNAHITKLDYLRTAFGNFEQVVIDRLDNVYAGLILKQQRYLQKLYACASCGEVYSSIEGGIPIKYDLAEFVCKKCLAIVDINQYDLEEKPIKPDENPEVNTEAQQENTEPPGEEASSGSTAI